MKLPYGLIKDIIKSTPKDLDGESFSKLECMSLYNAVTVGYFTKKEANWSYVVKRLGQKYFVVVFGCVKGEME